MSAPVNIDWKRNDEGFFVRCPQCSLWRTGAAWEETRAGLVVTALPASWRDGVCSAHSGLVECPWCHDMRDPAEVLPAQVKGTPTTACAECRANIARADAARATREEAASGPKE
jgi:hypothetical protein